MGQLPEARLKSSPAFKHVTIDLFQPYSVCGEVQKRTSENLFAKFMMSQPGRFSNQKGVLKALNDVRRRSGKRVFTSFDESKRKDVDDVLAKEAINGFRVDACTGACGKCCEIDGCCGSGACGGDVGCGGADFCPGAAGDC
ncbi:Hypothetical predicted protein [Paramuricea clavata]|uniref:Uncharacterized protein n=1 Tax=Paramuricea clavata TaxID=317549 RepID=A0A7D9K3N7_PARCT|nr:Hypothetical predicted protein [Paramuricea clavata]